MPKRNHYRHDEERLYPAVQDYFRGIGCKKVVADLPEEKGKVHMSRNRHRRDPDVVGIDESSGAQVIHIAEGKRFANGSAFEQCLGQLESLRPCADYLWAFVPKAEWGRLPEKDRERNVKLVRKQGAGLLLVDPEANHCEQIAGASKNEDINDEERESLLAQIGLQGELRFPHIETLGTQAAHIAAKTMALMCMVEFAYREIAGKTKPFHLSWFDDIHDAEKSARTEHWFHTGHYPNGVGLELDPFGEYLNDGVPVAWVCKEVSKDKMLAEAKAPNGLWSHCYWEEGEGDTKMVLVGDTGALSAMGHDCESFYLMRRIPLVGRTVSDVREEMRRIFKKAR